MVLEHGANAVSQNEQDMQAAAVLYQKNEAKAGDAYHHISQESFYNLIRLVRMNVEFFSLPVVRKHVEDLVAHGKIRTVVNFFRGKLPIEQSLEFKNNFIQACGMSDARDSEIIFEIQNKISHLLKRDPKFFL